MCPLLSGSTFPRRSRRRSQRVGARLIFISHGRQADAKLFAGRPGRQAAVLNTAHGRRGFFLVVPVPRDTAVTLTERRRKCSARPAPAAAPSRAAAGPTRRPCARRPKKPGPLSASRRTGRPSPPEQHRRSLRPRARGNARRPGQPLQVQAPGPLPPRRGATPAVQPARRRMKQIMKQDRRPFMAYPCRIPAGCSTTGAGESVV